MRILQVTPYFAPAYAYGGPPETVHRLSEALAERGHDLTVLTTDAFSATKRYAEKHTTGNPDIYYLRNVSNYLAWNFQFFLPLATGTFLQRHTHDFDVIHLHSFRTYQDVVVRRHALRAGIPYVFSAHGSMPRIVRMKLAKGLFDSVVGRSVLNDAAVLIAVSSAELRQYQAMDVPASKVAIIPNGIDAAQYSVLPPRGSFSRPRGLEGTKIVTYIGRLNSRKGLDTLVRSVREIRKIREDVELVLVGPDDGYRGDLERMTRRLSLQKHVHFAGMITMPKKLEVLVDSDVVVYPGTHEIFGLVPFEALLCRRPVVVADDSGCGEIVSEARAGITVQPGDPVALSCAIDVCLGRGQPLEEMIKNGERFVRSELDWTKIAVRMEEVYTRALSENRRNESR